VTIGDEMARSRNARMGGMVSKVQTQRQGDATFDVVVEIKSGMPNEWRVILDAASAVDSILSGKQYKAQVGVRLDHPQHPVTSHTSLVTRLGVGSRMC
jgi:hypothetical protein